MALRSKQEEIGELNVRKELAEKKLSTTIHESEISIEKLQVIFLNNKLFKETKKNYFLYHLNNLFIILEEIGRNTTTIKKKVKRI